MSTLRSPLLHAALLALSLLAGHAHAASSSTMRVGLTLVAPEEPAPAPQHAGVVNAVGEMQVDGARPEVLERAIARAPRVERSDLRADGSRVHSIQF